MSRRLEITVPTDWVDYVKDVLSDKVLTPLLLCFFMCMIVSLLRVGPM